MRLLALVILALAMLAFLSPALACAQDSFDIDAADGFPGMRFVAEPSKQLAASHIAWAPQDGVHVPRVLVPAIDVQAVIAQDAQRSGPLAEGVVVPLDALSLSFEQGVLIPQADGSVRWLMDVHARGAFGVRLHLSQLDLPQGVSVLVYDPQLPNNLPAPILERGPLADASVWAWTSWSDTARVDVLIPADALFDVAQRWFTIDKCVHMYRNPMTGSTSHFESRELPCHADVQCYPAWSSIRDSVGRMSFIIGASSFACSGSMTSTAIGDLTPYFLTARHCLQDSNEAFSSLEVYWFFQSPACNAPPPMMGSVPRTERSTYVYTSQASDVSLAMLSGTIPNGVWWNGVAWIPSVAEGSTIVGIHHPRGTYKRISFGVVDDLQETCSVTLLTEGNRTDFNIGLTEKGSSGSPLMLGDGRTVGVLSCGATDATCSDEWSIYGRWGSAMGALQFHLAAGPDDNYEDNDTCAQARSLDSFFNGSLTGLVVKTTDEDWYSITVPAFGSVTFGAGFQHSNGDVDLRLHSACGTMLAASGGLANYESLSWTNNNATPRVVQLRVYLASDVRNNYFLDFARYAPTPPPNDTCATQALHYLGFRNEGSTIASNVSASSSCDSAIVGGDVFFAFVTDCEREIELTTEGSDFDTVMSVSRDCLGGGTEIACNDDADPGLRHSRIVFTALGGTAYTVRISGYNGAVGRYVLRSFLRSGVPNDSCAAPTEIAEGTFTFNNCTAFTNGEFEDGCFWTQDPQMYRDVFFAWYAPCYGRLEVDTLGSNFDTRLAIYDAALGDCAPGPNTAVACNDDVQLGMFESLASLNVRAGARYIIRVGSGFQQVGGLGTVNVRFTQLPLPGDTCATAPDIDVGAIGWYTCASSETGPAEPCLAQPDIFQSRWLAYTPPCNGALHFDTLGYAADTTITVSDACAASTALACSDNVNELGESEIFLSVQAGTRYLLRVGNSTNNASILLSFNLGFEPSDPCISTCDSIDFNADGLFPDDNDLVDFLVVLAGGECSTGTCNDIDFNNDGLFPDDNDLLAFLRVLAGGSCE